MRLSLFVVGENVPFEFSKGVYAGGAAGIITSHCGPSVDVSEGYRPKRELKRTEAEGTTHTRPGDWVVTGEGQHYPGNGTDYTEIVIYKCNFQPLPEAREWTPVKKLEPAPELAIA
jgi:hypothetical protein